jgi:hypothetical protein
MFLERNFIIFMHNLSINTGTIDNELLLVMMITPTIQRVQGQVQYIFKQKQESILLYLLVYSLIEL